MTSPPGHRPRTTDTHHRSTARTHPARTHRHHPHHPHHRTTRTNRTTGSTPEPQTPDEENVT